MKQCYIKIGGENGCGKTYSFLVNDQYYKDDIWEVARRCSDLADTLYECWATKRGFSLANFTSESYLEKDESSYRYYLKKDANYNCEVRDVTLIVETINGVLLKHILKWSKHLGCYKIYFIDLINNTEDELK